MGVRYTCNVKQAAAGRRAIFLMIKLPGELYGQEEDPFEKVPQVKT